MSSVEDIITLTMSYLVGCLPFGYYCVRLLRREDIRAFGSGSTGATNVGRLTGRVGFFAILVLDAAKGAAVILVCRGEGATMAIVASAMIAVVAGHIWPVQLQFRGGKGVATSLGCTAVIDPLLLGVFAGLFLLSYILIQKKILSGLISFALLPIASAVLLPIDSFIVLGLGGVALLVWIAHRGDIRV